VQHSVTSSPVRIVVVSTLTALIIAVGCSTAGGAGGGAATAGASRGERFFKTKCNSCHPNGGQGAGPPIDLTIAPDFLERGKSSGRHAVPEADWEPLLGYMNQAFGAGAAVAAAIPGAPPAPPPAPAPGPVAAPPPPPAPPPVAAAAPADDAAAGATYYQTKCAKCHPGGSKITGKAVPGVLVAGGPGKHGVDPAQFNNLIAHLVGSLGAVAAGAPATAPTTPTTTTTTAVAPAGGGDAAAGGAYYQTKCQKCHPGGAKIVGKSVPGVLVAGGPGKHGVEAAQMENLLSYLVTIGAIRAGGGPVAAAPTGTGAPPPPPPPPSDGTIPMNAGMVNCSCACQCPAGAPPEALPAACLCNCSCPR